MIFLRQAKISYKDAPTSLTINKKDDKLDYIKIKDFCSSKKYIQMKKFSHGVEVICKGCKHWKKISIQSEKCIRTNKKNITQL